MGIQRRLPEVTIPMRTIRAFGATAFLVAVMSARGAAAQPTQPAGQSCPSTCDLSCQTCCSRWKLRSTCSGGESKDEADFRSFEEAQRAADARNRCAQGDAACEKRRLVCAGGTAPATWAPACDAKDRLAAPSATEGSQILDGATASLDASAKSLDEVAESLATLGRTRIVRDRGVPKIAAAADGVRSARERVRVLRAEGQRLRAGGASASDARAYAERASAAAKAATDAAAAAKSVLDDTTLVDTAAEERERRNAAFLREREAEEARRKAAREAAQEEAKRRAEEAEQRRKEAEAARVAAQEAAKRKLEEQRASAAATAAASAEEKKHVAAQKHEATSKGLAEVDAQLGAALASVAATLAVANISRDQRARAQATEQRLKALQQRSKDIRARADAGMQRAPADALYAASRAEVDLAALAAEVKTQTAAAAPSTGVAAAAPSGKDPAPVPSCIVDVVPPAGLTGATVALDGAKPVPLPTKVRVSSGRHALVVTQGARTARQSELVVCGRAQSISVHPLQ
jgi:hypothetical protein